MQQAASSGPWEKYRQPKYPEGSVSPSGKYVVAGGKWVPRGEGADSQPRSTTTLAMAVREKYPGIYDDLSDTELEARIDAKYPGAYSQFARTSEGGFQRQSAEFGPSNTPASILGAAFLGGKQPTGRSRQEFEAGGREGAMAVPAVAMAALPGMAGGALGALPKAGCRSCKEINPSTVKRMNPMEILD